MHELSSKITTLILFIAGVCIQTLVLAFLLRPFSYYENLIKLKNTSFANNCLDGEEEMKLVEGVPDSSRIQVSSNIVLS